MTTTGALDDSPLDECSLISGRLDEVRDRRDRECRAGAESGSGQAGSQAAVIGKPLERAPDRRAVDHAGADAGESIGEIQRRDRFRAAGAHPAEPGEDPAEHHQEPRSEAVDEPAFEGHEPCFEQDEDREGDLDGRLIHPELLLQRGHEQRPAVLEVRDGHHAENAEEENQPAVVAKTSHFVRCALHRIRSHGWHPPERSLGAGPARSWPVLSGRSAQPIRGADRSSRPSFPPAQAGGRSSSICLRNGMTPGMSHFSQVSSTLLWK